MRFVEGSNPVARRAFLMLGGMTIVFGMAMAVQMNIVTNYFEDVLGLAGPQFGYITAIREVPGFLLIFLTALFYRMSIPRLTAMALVVLAIGYALFGVSNSFWTVAPWVVISSMGYHTVLQTQYALGLSITSEHKSGSILGKMAAINNGGALVGMFLVLVAFKTGVLGFRSTFVICGALALIGAIVIFKFPNLKDGEVAEHRASRDRITFRWPYRYYYYLSVLDGARMQIFFSFGLWVLVNSYGMSVPEISVLLLTVNILAMLVGPYIGRLIDLRGERDVLGVINIAYIIALAGYAFTRSVYVAAACYAIYTLISPLSSVGAATYLRKVAVSHEIPGSLAMGVTLQHMAAIVVPIAAGFILNFVGYQVPFLIAGVFACFTIVVTRRLNPREQRTPDRVAEDAARADLALAGGGNGE